MRYSKTIAVGTLLLALTGLSACGSSDRPEPPPSQPVPPAPPPPIFTDFVKQQFADTADDTDPVAVDEQAFGFFDLEDPDAYDDLLSEE